MNMKMTQDEMAFAARYILNTQRLQKLVAAQPTIQLTTYLMIFDVATQVTSYYQIKDTTTLLVEPNLKVWVQDRHQGKLNLDGVSDETLSGDFIASVVSIHPEVDPIVWDSKGFKLS